MDFKDYYDVLGIKRDATQDEIKRAYRKMARKFHPDVSKEKDAEERFKEVNEAYEVLKDPEKRVAYDQLGANWQAGQDFQPPPDWDQGFEFHGGGYTDSSSADFSEFFENMFGRGGFSRGFEGAHQQGYSAQGNDTHAKIVIDLEDAYHGASRILTLKHTELDADGRPYLKERTLNVKIPKGIQQGQSIRLQGQGEPGRGKGKAGNLYLEVSFSPHSTYKVEGKDVYIDLPIAPWEAALGATINVPTPGGEVSMKVPKGSGSGKKLRLKGRGIPAKTAGDLYVVLQIEAPPANTEQARKAYEELKRACDFNPRSHMGV
jgi:curved DNA-binding protein